LSNIFSKQNGQGTRDTRAPVLKHSTPQSYIPYLSRINHSFKNRNHQHNHAHKRA